MKESAIQKKIMDYVKKNHPAVYMRKISGGLMFQRRGIPDLIGSIKGRFFAIEVKSETGRLTDLQKMEGLLILQAGGFYMCAVGYENFLALWRELIEKVG